MTGRGDPAVSDMITYCDCTSEYLQVLENRGAVRNAIAPEPVGVLQNLRCAMLS